MKRYYVNSYLSFLVSEMGPDNFIEQFAFSVEFPNDKVYKETLVP